MSHAPRARRSVRLSVLGLGVAAALALPGAAAFADGSPSAMPSAAPGAGKPLPCKPVATPGPSDKPTPSVGSPLPPQSSPASSVVPSPVPSDSAVPPCVGKGGGGKPSAMPSAAPTAQTRVVPKGGAQTGEGQTGLSTPELAGGAGLAAAGMAALAFAVRKRRAGAAR
jgi:hypothetical protein